MATITFTGPNPAKPAESSSTVVEVPDDLLLLTVQAAADRFDYQPVVEIDGKPTENPVGPGVFAIQKTIAVWELWWREYQQRQAMQAANEQIESALTARKADIVIKGE